MRYGNGLSAALAMVAAAGLMVVHPAAEPDILGPVLLPTGDGSGRSQRRAPKRTPRTRSARSIRRKARRKAARRSARR